MWGHEARVFSLRAGMALVGASVALTGTAIVAAMFHYASLYAGSSLRVHPWYQAIALVVGGLLIMAGAGLALGVRHPGGRPSLRRPLQWLSAATLAAGLLHLGEGWVERWAVHDPSIFHSLRTIASSWIGLGIGLVTSGVLGLLATSGERLRLSRAASGWLGFTSVLTVFATYLATEMSLFDSLTPHHRDLAGLLGLYTDGTDAALRMHSVASIADGYARTVAMVGGLLAATSLIPQVERTKAQRWLRTFGLCLVAAACIDPTYVIFMRETWGLWDGAPAIGFRAGLMAGALLFIGGMSLLLGGLLSLFPARWTTEAQVVANETPGP